MSKFLLWVSVSKDVVSDDKLLHGLVIASAVWDHKNLPKLLSIKSHAPKEDKDTILNKTKQKLMKFKFKPASLDDVAAVRDN